MCKNDKCEKKNIDIIPEHSVAFLMFSQSGSFIHLTSITVQNEVVVLPSSFCKLEHYVFNKPNQAMLFGSVLRKANSV